MANTLQGFQTALHGGGARANQFEVQLSGSGAVPVPHNFFFMCRSAQIPAMNIGDIAVPYRGRVIYLAGDRTYDAWTVTIYNDRAYSVRGALEDWMDDISDSGGTSMSNHIAASSYYAKAAVTQLDRNGEPIRTYNLEGLWPTTLDAIDLSWDANDEVETFGATFRFNWITMGGKRTPSEGTAGGGSGGGGPGGRYPKDPEGAQDAGEGTP